MENSVDSSRDVVANARGNDDGHDLSGPNDFLSREVSDDDDDANHDFASVGKIERTEHGTTIRQLGESIIYDDYQPSQESTQFLTPCPSRDVSTQTQLVIPS